jgi:cell division protein FtsA
MDIKYFTAVDIGETNLKIVVANYYNNLITPVKKFTFPSIGIENGKIVNKKDVIVNLKNSVKLMDDSLSLIGKNKIEYNNFLLVIPSTNLKVQKQTVTISMINKKNKIITASIVKELYSMFSRFIQKDEVITNVFPHQYEIDNRVYKNPPLETPATTISLTATFTSMPSDIAYSYSELFSSLQLNLVGVLPSICAQSYFLKDVFIQNNYGIVCDFGGANTTLGVVLNGIPSNVVSFNKGSKNFTSLIMKKMSIPFEVAEKIKKDYGNLNSLLVEYVPIFTKETTTLMEKDLHILLTDYFDEWKFELNRYYRDIIPVPNPEIILVGGGAELKGLDSAITASTGIHCKKVVPNMIGVRHTQYIGCLGILEYFFVKGEAYE